MTLQKREKILGISALVLLVLLALYWFWPASQGTLAELRAQRDAKKLECDNNQNRYIMAKKAAQRLKEWQKRALPANQEIAHSLYQNWLRNVISTAGFSNVIFTANQPTVVRDITANAGIARRSGAAAQAANNIYVQLSFTIQCQGTLEKLTKFLYDFYSAGHLHKINSLNITPGKNSSDLGLVMTVQALSMPTAVQKDKLYTQTDKILKQSLDDYKKTIVDRNLFAAYKEKKPDRPIRTGPIDPPPPPPVLDPLQFSYLTAIIEADGVPEAWLFERTTGQTLRLHEGDDFKIDKYKGKLNRIGYNEIEIEINGKTYTVNYGSNLKM
jgi:hypothetical protein